MEAESGRPSRCTAAPGSELAPPELAPPELAPPELAPPELACRRADEISGRAKGRAAQKAVLRRLLRWRSILALARHEELRQSCARSPRACQEMQRAASSGVAGTERY